MNSWTLFSKQGRKRSLMFDSLDAINFETSTIIYDDVFENILTKVYQCYEMMLKEVQSVANDENSIRDVLLKSYLKNNKIRRLVGFNTDQVNFEREVPEDHSTGRTDIKVTTINTFDEQDEYYTLECKRLDNTNTQGSTGLNAKYVENGVYRFTSKFYSSFCRVNAMVGFLVEDMDIHKNTENINNLLLQNKFITTKKKITQSNFINNCDYHYHSEHIDSGNEHLKIYHLMLDFNRLVS